MSWARVDDQFFAHPKVLDLSKDAKLLCLAGLTYCTANLTDGHISASGLRLVAATVDVERNVAQELVGAELWEARDGGGYYVHDYLKYNPSRATVQRNKEQSNKRGEAFRFKQQQGINPDEPTVENGVTNGVTNDGPIPSHPIPYPTPDSPISNTEAKEDTGVVNLTFAANAADSGRRTRTQFAYSPQFEDFWKAYPRRDGVSRGSKKEAWDVFRNLSSANKQLAQDGVEVYAKLPEATHNNGKYIVDAVRWLKKHRWETVEEEALAALELKINGGQTDGNSTGNSGQAGSGRGYRSTNERKLDALNSNLRLRARINNPEHFDQELSGGGSGSTVW